MFVNEHRRLGVVWTSLLLVRGVEGSYILQDTTLLCIYSRIYSRNNANCANSVKIIQYQIYRTQRNYFTMIFTVKKNFFFECLNKLNSQEYILMTCKLSTWHDAKLRSYLRDTSKLFSFSELSTS